MKKKKKQFNFKKNIILGFLLLIVIALSITYILKPSVDTSTNYDEDNYTFIINNLIGGGPPKDGIPSIDNAIYLDVQDSNLEDDEIIYGINYSGFIAAYPQSIMYWHEIVNEEINDEKISVTYCPLTGSVIGYKDIELGVSGALYNSNLVMYDRETDSRVPQILGKGIEFELQGKALETFPVVVTTWRNWREKFPQTKVLSRNTGYQRKYDENPYPGYDTLLRVWFPVNHKNNTLPTKEWVFSLQHNNEYLAIQINGFKENYPNGLDVEIGGVDVNVFYDEDLNTLRIDKENEITHYQLYWFAWVAHFPQTKLIKNY